MCGFYPFSSFSSITHRFCVPPTAKMHDCGGLMIAEKCVTPNMPKLETLKVPPWNSAGCNFPSRAFAASALTSFEIVASPLRSAAKTIGVIRPRSVETATDTSTASNLKEKKRVFIEIFGENKEFLLPNESVHPSRVCFGYFFACHCCCFDNEIVNRKFYSLFFQRFIQSCT